MPDRPPANARGRAHHRRLLCIGRRLHALPAQRRGEFAPRFQPGNHRIAGIGQALAGAPQGQRVAAPLCIQLAGRLARGQLRAAQAQVVGGLPVGQQRVPVLAACHRRQPGAAEALGHRLACITLQESLRLCRGDVVDVALERGKFQPAIERVAVQRGQLTGIGLAALCSSDGIAHGGQLRVQALGMQRSTAKAQQTDENSGKTGV